MGSCPRGVYSVVSSDSDSPSRFSSKRGLQECVVCSLVHSSIVRMGSFIDLLSCQWAFGLPARFLFR